jgi:hypothetical protein
LQRSKEGLILAEPKTNNARRQIMLSETAIISLRQHRARQAEERLALGGSDLRWCQNWCQIQTDSRRTTQKPPQSTNKMAPFGAYNRETLTLIEVYSFE